MKTILLITFALFTTTSGNASAEGNIPVICGGNVNGKQLPFRINPVNSVATAQDEEERLIFFINLSNQEKVQISFAEVLKDEEWESLQLVREKQEPAMEKLLKRIGAARIQQIWMGWSPGGFVHLESSQGGFTFSVSCQKTGS